ncbi:phthiocerol/phenolphthiocerol synthesis type-I polyketide synthase E [Catenulispora sp. EB89]|uniref:type I polyketide synthase n=1 Tax=Catenulispora sp. EB89 TaxID=3156257 RepID=UPI00351167AB
MPATVDAEPLDDFSEGVEPIAIVGMAARVPGADNIDTFWQNLVDGVESITFFSREELLAAGLDPDEIDEPGYVPAAPISDHMMDFDHDLFGMSPREADIADPQHRMFLETAHSALEDGGYDPARYPGTIGVYAGTGADAYMWLNLKADPQLWSAIAGGLSIATSNQPDYVATSVSYKLNLRGPSMTVHTACSTSMVAIHLAAEALRNGECDMALAGGVCVELPYITGYQAVEGYTSPDGHCRPFEARAAGTLWGSGAGVVLLKRLDQALADGDYIRSVIRGEAVNNDGSAKVGFSAPSVEGQTEAVAQAVAVSGVDPRSIGYVEAHGTGTALGDPIEVAALTAAYGHGSAERGWCGLGSVKSNIGHLSQAAGVVGVIKATLALQHRLIPPTVNFQTPNPAIDFDDTPFHVVSNLTVWDRDGDGGPRRAGVSSFGIGGTNAHLILQEAPAAGTAGNTATTERAADRPPRLLTLSARTAPALAAAATRLADHLAANPELDLDDVVHTLRVGRTRHPQRAAVVAADAADAVAALRDQSRLLTARAEGTAPSVAFMFSGQGSQSAGAGARLYRSEPVFAAAVDECCELLRPHLDVDVRDLMCAEGEALAAAQDALRETRVTQPALFVIEYALAELWRSRGVRPAAMIGHSIGEYVAATLSGVFELPDALRLVAGRGALMQSVAPGAMLAVSLDEAELRDLLPPELSLAAVNGPRACVVAGQTEAVEAFAARLAAGPAKVQTRMLRTSHAFHSAMMDPVVEQFAALVESVPRRAPQTPFLSNVTGDWITAEQAQDPGYWAGHLRGTVRFGDCVARLLSEGTWTLLECGPGRQLAGLARMQTDRTSPPLASLPGKPETELVDFERTTGALWTAGVPVELPEVGRRIPLPTYPYQRVRHWVDPVPEAAGAHTGPSRPQRGGTAPVSRWFAVPTRRQLPPDPRVEDFDSALAFVAGPRGAELAAELRRRGVAVTEVRPGTVFDRDGAVVTLRTSEPEDYRALVAGGLPGRIVHAWALDGEAAGSDLAAAALAQEHGFLSVLTLVQALVADEQSAGVHLDVVSAGAEDVLGGDLTRPEHATLAGITRVLPLEMPERTVRRIDADPAGSAGELVAELRRPAGAETVALRGGRRWAIDYEQVEVPDAPQNQETETAEGPRWLITGGTGGIGITLAEDLVNRTRARVVLLARSPLPDRTAWDDHLAVYGTADRTGRTITAVRRMEALGGEVLVLAGDVADPADLRRVRERIVERFGGLDGIVHAAGVAGGGMLEIKERETALAVLEPKISGTLALFQAFGDLDLDTVALCSSVTSVAGGFGQVDYCAANAFLDAYARSEHGWKAKVVSLNWGGWLEVGMAVETPQPGAAATATAAVRLPGQGVAMDHPVLTERGAGWARGLVSAARHWVLAEHRIDGVPVLPGTGHLECARAAIGGDPERPAERVLELRDVAFVEPFAVPDGTLAEYRVQWSDGTFRTVSVAGGRTRVHVRGAYGWIDPGPAPRHDPQAMAERFTKVDAAVAETESGRTSILTFGPRWESLAGHHVGDGEELALIAAPEAALGDLSRWDLHPALLDVATSFGSSRGEGSYLPLGYGSLLVRAPLPARFHAHMTYRGDAGTEVLACDVTLFDESGRELAAIGDFVLRRVDPGAVAADLAGAGPEARVVEQGPGTGGGIAPADGAEAFARVLATDLGAQVVIHPRPVAEIIARVQQERPETMADGVQGSGSTSADGSDGEARALDGAGYVAPRTEVERALAESWMEVLGVPRVGVEDDFFELGGNSLIAVQLVTRMRKAVGVRLPMRSLFETPTVAGLAARVEQMRTDDGPAPTTIPRIPRA